MSKKLYPAPSAFTFIRNFCFAALLLLFGINNQSSAQCSIAAESNTGITTPSGCGNGNFSLGSGAYYNLSVNPNTYYVFSFSNQGNGCISTAFCATPQNGTGNSGSFTSNQTAWFSGTTTLLQVSSSRNGCFNGTSAVMTYAYTTPTISAIAASPNPVCVGSTLNLSSTTSNAAVLSWAGPNSFSSATNNPSVTNIQTSGGGTYTLSATNSGCSVTRSVTVVVNTPSTVPTGISGTTLVCNGSGTTLTATGGTLGTGATYQWGTGSVVGTSPISGATNVTYTVSPTVATGYWVSITGSGPCGSPSGGATISISVNNPSTAPTGISGTTAVCNGTGTTLTATGGTLGTGATYQWGTGSTFGVNAIGGATNSTYSVTPGSTTNYWVSITGPAPCGGPSGGATTTVTVNSAGTAPTGISGNTLICSGSSTVLTATGGSLGNGGGNYQWGTGSVVGTNSIVGATTVNLSVTPGSTTSYWVSVTGSGPCPSPVGGVSTTVTVNTPSTAPTGVSGTTLICNGAGTTLTATGGTLGTGATYQWGTGSLGSNPISGETNATYTVTPLSTTNYWVSITGAAPCGSPSGGATNTVTVNTTSTAPTGISGTTTLCAGFGTTLTATGGSLGTGATYQWGTGAVAGTSPISGATAVTYSVTPAGTGSYWVSITGPAPCGSPVGSATTNVTVNPTPNGFISGTTSICSGSNTEIYFNFTVGTGPFNIGYSDGTNVYSLTGVNNGDSVSVSPSVGNTTYQFTSITDVNGCNRNASGFLGGATITVTPLPVIAATVTPALCYGSSTGTIVINATSGSPGYTYSIDSGTTYQSSNTFTGLPQGTDYVLKVVDSHGCSSFYSSNPVTINQPTPLTQTDASTQASCANVFDGSITITATGGVAPYNYSLSGGPSQSGSTFNNLGAGNYIVQVADFNGCTDTAHVTITNSYAIADSLLGQTNVSCFGGSDGAMTVQLTGGVNPYSYSDNGSTFQTSPTFTGLNAGNYVVTLRDSRGCTAFLTVAITQPGQLDIIIDSLQNVLCAGASQGAIYLSVTGGTAPYSYSWSNNATTQDITGLSAGTYNVTVLDSKGCNAASGATITQPLPLFLNVATYHNLTCYNDSSGFVYVNVSGGVPPYTFNWSNGATTQDISGLGIGNYTLTVVDANSCQQVISQALTQPTQLTSTISASNVNCNGASDGTVTFTVSGGTGSYTYLWNNGATTQNLTNVSGGTYTVVARDANGCSLSNTINVAEPAAVSISVSSTNVSCNGGSNGSVTLTVNGGSGTITYSWNNGATTQNLVNVGAGTYSVSISDVNGCTATASATVTEPAALALNGTSSDVSCFGGSNGSVAITVNGGVFPYSYAWSSGATTQNINNVSATTYLVTATDANGCNVTGQFVINAPTALTSSVIGTDVTCHGQANGTATLTVGGGTPAYTYSWSNFQITQNLVGLSGGTYYVTITDANGCTKRDSVIISEPSAIVLGISSSNVSCNGGSNASVTTTVNGGTNPISYLWNNNATTANLTNVGAGSYSVVITDGNGCTASASATVTQPAALVLNGTVANVLCSGGSNGSVAITVNGGVFPYSYAWSNGATTQNINNVSANTYTVTATDANSCNISASFTVTSPSAITSSVTGTNVTCHGQANGTATLTVGGGTSPYSYSWSNFQATQNLSGLSGGTYYVIITDANGCTRRDSVIITEPAAIVLGISSTNVNCNGGTNGTVTTTVTGGTNPITYLWSNNATTANLSGVGAGNYSVVITDGNGCTASASATITQPAALVLNGTVANVLCAGGNNGSIAITVNGGVFPYGYAWDNGATTQNLNNLTAGGYAVTVTDANGCSITASFNVGGATPITSNVVGTNVTCHGQANGTATLTVNGGTTPYTFFWSNFQISQNISGLSGGTYYVVITDANSCTHRDSVIITEPAAIVVGISSTNVSCNGGANGTVTTTVTGGTNPIHYLWSNNATTANLSNAGPGTYSVVITDGNGCTASASTTVTQPAALVLSGTANNVACSTGNNGSVQLSVYGGVLPYTYLWSNGATTQDVNGLTGGFTYTVTVTDANLCTSTASFTITSPAALVVGVTGTDVTCHGAANGTATVTTSGGTAPYTNLWSNFQGSSTINNLSGGLYFVIVTDANGCSSKDSITIAEPTQLVIATNVTQINCFNANNGAINLTVTGGVPNYSYSWTPTLSNSPNQSNLAAGTYVVTVTDNHSCTVSTQVDIINPPSIALNFVVTDPRCFGDANGIINLIVSGGAPAYSYLWSNGATTQQINNASTGTYYVTVTDSRGCIKSDSAVVATPSQLYTAGVIKNVSCFGKNDGSVNVTVYGGTLPYSYNWSGGQSTVGINLLSGGSYTLTVTDASGCQVASLYVVTEPSLLTLGLTGTNVSCFGGSNGTITTHPSGGTKPYRYTWEGTVSSDSIVSGLSVGLYGVQLTDSNGCYTFDSIAITQPTRINISGFANNVVCFNTATGSVDVTSVTGGTPGYSYAWSNGGVGANINTISAGVYVVTVSDANNCSETASFTVTQGTRVIVSLATYDPICYNGNTGSVTALVSGGSGPYRYVWSNGVNDTTVALNHLTAGTYFVTVTDNVGCSVTANGTLNQPAAITLTPSVSGIRCVNSASGLVVVGTTGGTAPFNYSLNGYGQSSDTFTHVSPGSYHIIATDVNGCQGTDTFSISAPNTISVSLNAPDQFIITGMETQLFATATSTSPITHYYWSPSVIDSADVIDFSSCGDSTNCSSPFVKPPFTTTFSVTVMNADSCTASDTVTVIVTNAQPPAFFPTAFTPNGDGLNDRFTFAILGASKIEVSIFDRWGERVYYDPAQPNGVSDSYGWDGTKSGKNAPEDTYVYQLRVTYFDNTVKTKTGTVTLMR